MFIIGQFCNMFLKGYPLEAKTAPKDLTGVIIPYKIIKSTFTNLMNLLRNDHECNITFII